ncbi:MAG: hypothetical protein KatS3mg090_0597 [Patescibacteria group bacterium]|nr:MAG: hypothetical protein KatS3mg090_0597 [Patescibacteria group bacterium]
MKSIQVIKSDGSLQKFKRRKLIKSLINSGVKRKLANSIAYDLEKRLQGSVIKSNELFSLAYDLVKERSFGLHLNYSLKSALFRLGPTGYPFEKFVASVLRSYGYVVTVDVVLSGSCVDHEIDVLAEKKDKVFFVESKFHNSASVKTNVKTTLYIYARYLDLIENKDNLDKWQGKNLQPWIFTNTKFTQDAIKYAFCKGFRLTSWNYPERNSLAKIIEKKLLHPITIFSELDDATLKSAFEKGIVTLKDFMENSELSEKVFSDKYLTIKLQIQSLLSSFNQSF